MVAVECVDFDPVSVGYDVVDVDSSDFAGYEACDCSGG